jgi:hypothetical protein
MVVFVVSSVAGLGAGAVLDGTAGDLTTFISIAGSLVSGVLIVRREPAKSFLALRQVRWFGFVFNAGLAVCCVTLIVGVQGTMAGVGLGTVSLGMGFSLIQKRSKPQVESP